MIPTSVKPIGDGKFPVLISYAYAREDEGMFGRFAERDDVELLLDCGAFTALNAGKPIDLKEYIEFLRRWRSRLFGYLALDVVGDPVGTERNLATMLDAGLRPIPVHVRGDGEDRMNELFAMSDWVACGGLRRPHAGHCQKTYVKQKMLWAAGRNVHWLGYTNHAMVRAFKPYSCDCSNMSMGYRFGNTQIYLGNWVWSNRSTRASGGLDKPFTRQEADAIMRAGLTVESFRDPAALSDRSILKNPVAYITAWSWASFAVDMLRRVGTRVFMACSPARPNETDLLLRLIESTK